MTNEEFAEFKRKFVPDMLQTAELVNAFRKRWEHLSDLPEDAFTKEQCDEMDVLSEPFEDAIGGF